MNVAARSPVSAGALVALCGLLLLCACAPQGIRLSDSERANLDRQPAIYVLHYQSPAPVILAGGKNPPPTATEVRKHAGADPAALVAQSFSRLLAKKEKLDNLHVEPRHLPLPVATDTRLFRDKFRNGLVLELWVSEWNFSPLPADTKTYLMTLNLRSRLSRVDNGQILWSTGSCSVGGNTAGNRDMRLTRTELTSGTRLRKLLATARDECARQLLRDLDNRGANGKS